MIEKLLGVDIGGSGIKAAPVTITTGRLHRKRHRIETPKPATPKAIAEVVRKLVEEFEYNGPIGCGFPAAVQQGIIRTASNIDKSWIGLNAEKLFEDTIGMPFSILNDADAAGLAEMKFGAGRDHQQGVVAIITVGTGLGTALFSNGILVPNTELGHLPMRGKIAEYWAADSARSRLKLKWKDWRPYFLEYLKMLHDLFWPQLIIIGGGISKKPDRFMPTPKEFETLRLCPIVPAQMKNKAGIVGAALAAHTLLQHPASPTPEQNTPEAPDTPDTPNKAGKTDL